MTKEQAGQTLENMGFREVNKNGCFVNNRIRCVAYIEYDVRVGSYHIRIYSVDNS